MRKAVLSNEQAKLRGKKNFEVIDSYQKNN